MGVTDSHSRLIMSSFPEDADFPSGFIHSVVVQAFLVWEAISSTSGGFKVSTCCLTDLLTERDQ